MKLPSERIPFWVTCLLWAATIAVVAAGVLLQGDEPVNWPLCVVMFALAYFGLQVAFDIPGFIVQDSGTPALAISAFVLGPGPATVIACLTVVLMPDATARFRGRDDGMSAPAVAINTFAASVAVLGAALLFDVIPEMAVAQLLGAVVLYLFIEVVASALAMIPLALLDGKNGVMFLFSVIGPLFTLQALGARIIAPLTGYGPVAAAIAAQDQPIGQLNAEVVPLAARVIAVADAYSSMVSGSAQVRAHDPLTALARLRAQAGQRFDAQVVEALGRTMLAEGLQADEPVDLEHHFERRGALTEAHGERSPLQLAAAAT